MSPNAQEESMKKHVYHTLMGVVAKHQIDVMPMITHRFLMHEFDAAAAERRLLLESMRRHPAGKRLGHESAPRYSRG
jgi:hypothetical protein